MCNKMVMVIFLPCNDPDKIIDRNARFLKSFELIPIIM